jgi:hypothetical protein
VAITVLGVGGAGTIGYKFKTTVETEWWFLLCPK